MAYLRIPIIFGPRNAAKFSSFDVVKLLVEHGVEQVGRCSEKSSTKTHRGKCGPAAATDSDKIRFFTLSRLRVTDLICIVLRGCAVLLTIPLLWWKILF
jgi:hypothetical protein